MRSDGRFGCHGRVFVWVHVGEEKVLNLVLTALLAARTAVMLPTAARTVDQAHVVRRFKAELRIHRRGGRRLFGGIRRLRFTAAGLNFVVHRIVRQR